MLLIVLDIYKVRTISYTNGTFSWTTVAVSMNVNNSRMFIVEITLLQRCDIIKIQYIRIRWIPPVVD